MPAADMALMIGIRPTRIASRRLSEIARRQSWPSASRVSMTSRLCAASWVRRSSPSEMPFIVLPRIMPSSGMAYCGAYQGSVPMTTTSARTVTANDDTNIDRVPTPNPHQPTKRRCWRTITSRPATVSITAASSATHTGWAWSKRTLSTRPIRNSCTVLRSAEISSCRSLPICMRHESPASARISSEAMPRSAGES
jgi:hypothetical protein